MTQQVKYIAEFPSTDNTYGEDDWYRHHGNSTVIINCKSSAIYYPEHWTPLSMKCAFNGKEFYKLRSTTYAVNDSTFLLLNEGNRYESFINSESITESFTINFTQNNIRWLAGFMYVPLTRIVDEPFTEASYSFRIFEKLYPHSYETLSYIDAIKKNSNDKHSGQQKTAEILYLFLNELINLNITTSLEIDNVHAKKRTTREEIYKRLHIAKDYIQSCYEEDISLEALSRICFLNPFHLLREFKQYFRTTPHKYLTGVRLAEAKKLLQGGKNSIFDIAYKVGYEDVSSFSKLFKNHFGLSPEAYRKIMK
ncbi:MAG: AraC family transcriptional regulator [Ginsengibacter sp.]